MNSPWGIIFSVIRETKWTMHQVLWKNSWINIQLMMKDAPGYKFKTGNRADKEKDENAEFREFLKDF